MSSSSSAPSLATNASSTSTPSPMSSLAPRPAKVLNLPPGYHFLPTDAELVVHYLRPRLANAHHRLRLPIFVHERILDYHPDILIEKYRPYGEGRWFFFTERERKHTSGNRPNRSTPDNGHWNATGSVRPIRSAGGVLVGCRRTLVFYEASRSRKKKKNQLAGGLPPTPEEEEGDEVQAAKAAKDDGVKTEWTMYEYQSLTSEAEFEALRAGNANKVDELVLCTIQKKKHGQEGGERKKSTKRKTKEEGLELEEVPAGSRGGTAEGHYEDDVQRALMEAAAETQVERAYHGPAAGAGNFNHVDPNQSMPYYYLTNSLSPVPTPSQETLMTPVSGDNPIVMHQKNYHFGFSMTPSQAPPVMELAARGNNHTVMHQRNYGMNHSNMWNSHFPVQATVPQEEFPPYSGTKTAAPLGGGGSIVDHHMLQNVMPAAEAHNTFNGFFPSPSSSNYGHLSTRMDHPAGPSSVPFPSQQSHGAGSRTGMQGPLLNNQVNLHHQNSSMGGYDQRNGVGLAPKIV